MNIAKHRFAVEQAEEWEPRFNERSGKIIGYAKPFGFQYPPDEVITHETAAVLVGNASAEAFRVWLRRWNSASLPFSKIRKPTPHLVYLSDVMPHATLEGLVSFLLGRKHVLILENLPAAQRVHLAISNSLVGGSSK